MLKGNKHEKSHIFVSSDICETAKRVRQYRENEKPRRNRSTYAHVVHTFVKCSTPLEKFYIKNLTTPVNLESTDDILLEKRRNNDIIFQRYESFCQSNN